MIPLMDCDNGTRNDLSFPFLYYRSLFFALTFESHLSHFFSIFLSLVQQNYKMFQHWDRLDTISVATVLWLIVVIGQSNTATTNKKKNNSSKRRIDSITIKRQAA